MHAVARAAPERHICVTHGIAYIEADPAWSERIVRLLSESFSREPISVALGLSRPALAALIERFIPECTRNGLSALAVPVERPDTLAGAFLCRDYAHPMPPGVPEDFAWFAPVAVALGEVGEAYASRRGPIAPGRVVDMWMVGVRTPDYARRGIATRLFRAGCALARARGYAEAVTECTGRYSLAAAGHAGYTAVSRLAYADFRFGGRAVLADVAAPHTHLTFCERPLRRGAGRPDDGVE